MNSHRWNYWRLEDDCPNRGSIDVECNWVWRIHPIAFENQLKPCDDHKKKSVSGHHYRKIKRCYGWCIRKEEWRSSHEELTQRRARPFVRSAILLTLAASGIIQWSWFFSSINSINQANVKNKEVNSSWLVSYYVSFRMIASNIQPLTSAKFFSSYTHCSKGKRPGLQRHFRPSRLKLLRTLCGWLARLSS